MTEAAPNADRASVRDPAVLISVAVVIMFALGYGFSYFVTPPSGSEQAIGQMQGALIGALGAVITYWIGSSRGSRRNADRADKAVEALDRAVEGKK